jgi:hypothetical protein
MKMRLAGKQVVVILDILMYMKFNMKIHRSDFLKSVFSDELMYVNFICENGDHANEINYMV